jgi:hypothetical protein
MGIALEMYVSDYGNQYPLYLTEVPPNQQEYFIIPWERCVGFYYPPPPGGIYLNPLNWTNASAHCPGYKGVIWSFEGHEFVGSHAYNQYGASRCLNAPYGYGFRHGPDVPLKQSEVLAPSEMVAITEARYWDSWAIPGYGPGSFYGSDEEFPGNDTVDPFTVVIQKPAQHGRLFNVLSCDGHVPAMKVADLLQDSKSAQLWNYDHQPHPEGWVPGW